MESDDARHRRERRARLWAVAVAAVALTAGGALLSVLRGVGT